MNYDVDPLSELLDYVDRMDVPPQVWIDTWSKGHQEPLRAAWLASSDTTAMLGILAAAHWPHASDISERHDALINATEGGDVDRSARQEALIRLVRSAVPDPPTLAQLLLEQVHLIPRTEPKHAPPFLGRKRLALSYSLTDVPPPKNTALVFQPDHAESRVQPILSISPGHPIETSLDDLGILAGCDIEILPQGWGPGRLTLCQDDELWSLDIPGGFRRVVVRVERSGV